MGRSPCCDKMASRKVHGRKKKMPNSWNIFEFMDRETGEHSPQTPGLDWFSIIKKSLIDTGLQRCGKSCRLRWTNYLRPDIKRGRFSFEEEETIIQLHSVLGNKWSAIAARLPGRTDNEIKNYWNTHIRKRLLKGGIDPVTHSPRLDHLDISSILNSAHLSLSNLLNFQTLLNPEILKLATLLASSSSNQENLMNHMDQTLTNHQLPSCTSMPTSLPSTQYLSPNMNGQIVDEILMPPCLPDNHGMLPSQNFNFDSVLSTPMSSPTPLNSSSTLVNSSSTEDDRETNCSMFKFEIPESFEFDDFM